MTPIVRNSQIYPRIGNVSAEADADFISELKRTDRARYDRLIEAMRKQAYKSLRNPAKKACLQPTDSKGQILAVSAPEPISQSAEPDRGLGAKNPASNPTEAAQ
jgi:hypothetical protein